MRAFFGELKRRNVFKVGAAYAVAGWLLIQGAAILLPTYAAPAWVMPVFTTLVIGGFPVALILAWAFQVTPEGVRPTAQAAKISETSAGAPAPTQAIEKPVAAVLANSVAVLPFENMSPKPDDAYFAAGLHEEVLNRLAQISALNVIARTSVMRFAKTTKPVPEIARELNVMTVMEGSVRFAGERVRVTMQLIDGATDMHLWSETYERPLGDIFAIESDIAMNVANALQATLSPIEQERITEAPTKSPEAYALFLRANDADEHGETDTAMDLLERAIKLDPEFAAAYGRMALRQSFNTVNTNVLSAVPPERRAEFAALSRKNAERAIALDPHVPYAHAALAMPAIAAWRWTEAEKAFESALDAAPNDDRTRRLVGLLLSALGRHEEAIAIAKRAVDLDPDHPNAGWYAMQVGFAGRYDEAAAVLERAIVVDPTDLILRDWLAFMEVARGNPAAAIKQLEISEKIAAGKPLVVFLPEWAYAYSRAGRRQDAARLFNELELAVEKGARPGAGGWAMACLAVGDEKQALEWLEKAAEKAANHQPDEGYNNLINLKLNVTNDPVLKRSEFVEVLSRIRGD